MKRILLILATVLLCSSAWAATKVQVMTDGKIDVDKLPTIAFSLESDPASPEDGRIWWNETTKQLKVADTLGIYEFNTAALTAWDTTPEAFSFTDVVNATTETLYTSDAITVSGINHPAAISVSGDASAKYSVNNAAAVSTNGTVSAGDEVRAVVASSASDGTAVNATVTIGGVSDAFSVTTAVAAVGEDGFVGRNSTDNTWDRTGADANVITLWRYEATTSGAVSQMGVYAYGEFAFPLAIYSDNEGEPGSLVGSTANAIGTWAFTWRTAALSESVNITSGNYYWIGFRSTGDGMQFRADGGTSQEGRRYTAASFPSTWPTADDAELSSGDRGGAIYAIGN